MRAAVKIFTGMGFSSSCYGPVVVVVVPVVVVASGHARSGKQLAKGSKHDPLSASPTLTYSCPFTVTQVPKQFCQ
jgi:hypothetical protein